ncbi:MAG: hypothetical protein ACXVCO_12420 [Ktedonobacterales bacterium]
MVDNRDGTVDGDNRESAPSSEGGDAATTPDLTEHEAGATDQVTHESSDAAGDLTSTEISEPVEDPYEGAVPPGYDWPTHGGYLGCLMGVVALSIVGTLIAAPLLALLTYSEVVPLPVSWLLTALVFVLCIFGGGRLGWALGKRFYREYPRERPTWGESDDAEVEGVVAEDKESAGETSVKA